MADIKKGIYRHYKGNIYEVVGLARHSESLEEMVVYKAANSSGEMWVRPSFMWNELVLVEGKKVKRFTYIGDSL